MCTDVEWDPSGRYVATSVSYYRHQMENGYTLWTFQGKQFLSLAREKFLQFQWRPRPASVLDEKRLKVIAQSLPINTFADPSSCRPSNSTSRACRPTLCAFAQMEGLGTCAAAVEGKASTLREAAAAEAFAAMGGESSVY